MIHYALKLKPANTKKENFQSAEVTGTILKMHPTYSNGLSEV